MLRVATVCVLNYCSSGVDGRLRNSDVRTTKTPNKLNRAQFCYIFTLTAVNPLYYLGQMSSSLYLDGVLVCTCAKEEERPLALPMFLANVSERKAHVQESTWSELDGLNRTSAAG